MADYAVGASAVLGIRDSGKTVTSKGLAEQLLDHGVPVIVFDAVGKWRWMKVAAEHARGKAYKVVVAGGREPDLPLTPQSVPEIVRAALKEHIPLVIDLYSKAMSKADWRSIVQTAIRIIHYENEGGAVHVFLEEAAEFVPQIVYDKHTYAEVEKLVRMGGNASVGITLINQRSQEINKAVLDQCSTALVLGCQVGKNAIKAIEGWVERLEPATAKEVTASLPRLQSGEAWVWTRANLVEPSLQKMPMCRSFHPDRRTPETITVANSPRVTDVAQFVARMADTIPKAIEEAKANDPAELKRTIADLKRKLADAQRQTEVKQAEPVEVQILSQDARNLLEKVAQLCERVTEEISHRAIHFQNLSKEVNSLRAEVGMKANRAAKPVAIPHRKPVRCQTEGYARIIRPSNGEGLGKCETAILSVLSQHGSCSIGKLALLSGYCQSGSFKNSLSALRAAGYISGLNSQQMQLTDDGERQGPFPVVETGLEYWLNFPQFGQCERSIIDTLSRNGPMGIESLAQKAGYEVPVSGSFKNSLSSLRTAGVIVGSNREQMRLADEVINAK